MRSELAALNEEYLLCRDKMHRWVDFNVVKDSTQGALRVIEKCEVCDAERTSLLSLRKASYGHILRRWMSHYPDGYLMPKGAGRLDVDDRGELRMHRLGY